MLVYSLFWASAVQRKKLDNFLFPCHLEHLWKPPGHEQGKEWNLATHREKNKTYNVNFDQNALVKTRNYNYNL